MPGSSSPESEARPDSSASCSTPASTRDQRTRRPKLADISTALEASRKLRVAVVGAIFTATTLIYLWQALLGLGTFAAVDMNEFGDPYRSAIDRPPEVANIVQTDQVEAIPYIVAFTDGLKEFEYRLWDPNIAAGVPLGLMPTFLMVSPFNVSFMVSPPWYAIGLKVALQFLVGQTLMYLFLRRMRVGVLPAALGAVVYVFSGTNISLLHRMTVTFVVPGALWAAHRVLASLRVRDVGLLAIFVGWGWLEGFPSGWAYLVYVTVGWIAWLILADLISGLRDRTPGVWLGAAKQLGAGIAGIVTGTLLVAFTMIPFVVEIIDRGTLEGRVLAASVAPLRPAQLLGLVDGATLGEWRGAAYDWWSGTNPVESVALVGAIVAILAVVGYVGAVVGRLRLTRDARSAWTYLSFSAALLTIATYFGTPVLTVVNRLPGLAGNPVNRTRFVVALAAATVVAMTVDWITSRPRSEPDQSVARRRGRAPRVASAAMLVGIGIAGVLAVRDWIPLARSNGQLRSLATSMAWLAVASVVVVAIAVLVSQRRTAAPWVVIGLGAIAYAQLVVPYYGFTPTAPIEDFYEETPGHEAIEALAEGQYRFAATGLTAFYPNGSQITGPPDLRGLAMHSTEFKELVKTINPIAFDRDAFKIILAPNEWDLSAPALDHLAVKYFALDTRETPLGTPRDFVIETTASAIGGLGPYSVAGGTDGGQAFVVEVDESTTANRIQRMEPSHGTTYLEQSEFVGSRVAVGDLDGVAGEEVLIVPSGPGDAIEIFDASGELLRRLRPGRIAAPGGWWPAIGDTDGDGRNEIILGTGAGAPPMVTVLASDGAIESEFAAYDLGFFGGVVTAVGDVDDDGIGEIIVGPGAGGGPHVRVLDQHGVLDFEFFAFDPSYTGGVAVAAGDPVAGGGAEIVTASLDGSQPVRVFAGASHIGTLATAVSGYHRIAAGDIIDDRRDEILVGGDAPTRASVSVASAEGELAPDDWAPLTAPAVRHSEVSGPFSGVAVALAVDDACEAGTARVVVRDMNGGVTSSSERELRDLVEGWNTFAVDGVWAADGTDIKTTVENRSDCTVQMGTVENAAGPAVRWFEPDPEAALVSTTQAWIYERPSAWSIVSVHGDWRGYETQEEALHAMLADPQTVPYVGPASDVVSGGPAPTLVETEITRQGAVATTEGSAGGLVVFSQNDALGWNVYIDGVATDHVSVDGALLGAIVPPGRHTVEFAYEPRHFAIGVAVSSATVVAVGIIVLLGLVRDRRRRDS